MLCKIFGGFKEVGPLVLPNGEDYYNNKFIF